MVRQIKILQRETNDTIQPLRRYQIAYIISWFHLNIISNKKHDMKKFFDIYFLV